MVTTEGSTLPATGETAHDSAAPAEPAAAFPLEAAADDEPGDAIAAPIRPPATPATAKEPPSTHHLVAGRMSALRVSVLRPGPGCGLPGDALPRPGLAGRPGVGPLLRDADPVGAGPLQGAPEGQGAEHLHGPHDDEPDAHEDRQR